MDLSSFKPQDENEILKEIKEKELSEDEISSLINLGKKDILIALARSQKLSSDQIKDMLVTEFRESYKHAPKNSINQSNKHPQQDCIKT